jgi:hypothetical protein
VTGSAFTQARYKIRHEFFKCLCKLVRQTYEDSALNLWKEFRLMAADGSTLNLPPTKEIQKEFGIYAETGSGTKRCLARIFFIYDPLNDFVIEGQMDKMEKGEITQLYECLDNIPSSEKDLLILDRNFGHYSKVNEFVKQDRKFCIRLPVKNSIFARNCMASPDEDFITRWSPSEKERANTRARGMEPVHHKVRVTKIALPSGEIELLVSNLFDMDSISIEDLKELYGLRWGVEEGFKNLKPKMKIEQFGCRKKNGLYQEFYAHILCMNMVALSASIAQAGIKKKVSHRKYAYKYNWKNAYRFLRERMVRWLSLKDIRSLLVELLRNIERSITAIIPDRNFARDTNALNKRGRISQYNK